MSAIRTVIIRAARAAGGFVVQIEGWGTMQESPALAEFGLRCLADGSGDLAVDLSACDYLDSTFLGCLVDLHKRFVGARGQFSIVAAAEAQRRLLHPLKLDKILPLAESAPPPTGEWMTLCSGEIQPRDLGQHVLDCHRQLVELGGDNEAVFGPIVQRLARELDAAEECEDATKA